MSINNKGFFLDIVSGITNRVQAILHSSGSNDADKIIRLDSTGRISDTVLPVGIVADTQAVVASETLTANDLVNIWDNASVPNVRRADAVAVNKFRCVGFVKDNFNVGETALVYFEGRITGLTGLTPGAPMFLATTPGQASPVPVFAAEELSQIIGTATDATSISFERASSIILAPAEV